MYKEIKNKPTYKIFKLIERNLQNIRTTVGDGQTRKIFEMRSISDFSVAERRRKAVLTFSKIHIQIE